MKQTTSFESA